MTRSRARVCCGWVCGAISLLGAGVSPAVAQEDGTSPGYLVAPPAVGDSPASELTFGIGYAHLSLDGSDFDSESALRFDGAYTLAPIAAVPQIRIGAAFGLAMVFDDSERAIISDGGIVVVGHSDVPLFVLEPEFRLSWRQPLGGANALFLEPGIGVGAAIAFLDTGPYDESDTSFSTRAFLNLGFPVPGGAAGIQASYLWADHLDLADNAQGDFNEFYIGIFGTLRF